MLVHFYFWELGTLKAVNLVIWWRFCRGQFEVNMKSQDKRLNEKQVEEQQAKKPGEKCDYLHPEECSEKPEKDSLSETRKRVEKQADQFIEEKTESDEDQD